MLSKVDRLNPGWAARWTTDLRDSILIHWESTDGLNIRADYQLDHHLGSGGIDEFVAYILVEQRYPDGRPSATIYCACFCEGKNQRAGRPYHPSIAIDPDSCYHLRDYIKRVSLPILQREDVANAAKREAELQARARDEREARQKFFGR